MASVPVTALKKNEDGIVDSLKNADLECLSEDALEIGVIPQDVRDAVGSMDWDHVRRPRVIRYLLMHVYRAIEDSPRLYERWLHILSEHVATAEVLDKVRERYGFLMQCDNLLAHTEDLPEEEIPVKRPQPQNLFTEQHIPKLTDMLVACAGKYMEMSIFLGLPEHIRKDLSKMSFTESGIAAFSRLLWDWIMGRHSHACDPTLENLERALRSEMVGLGEIANRLKDNLYDSGITFKTDEQDPMSQTKLLRCEVLPFEIVRQSRDAIVTEGKTTLLEVQAVTSRDYITYQWMKDGCPLEDTNQCQRYNNILCIRDCDQSSNGKYTCELSDGLNTCSSRPITLTVNISSVKKALVDRYSTQPEVPADSWPPEGANTCINLALIKQGNIAGKYARKTIQGDVDDIMTEKESIEYDAAFTNLNSAMRFLIEGRPGSGKTTLVHRFSKDWARGNPKLNLKNIKLLFLVHLRGFFNDPNITLRDVLKLYYSEESKIDTIIHEAEANSGEGLCFILDGLDEYRPKPMKNTFVFRLIQRQTLPKAIVVTASRPAASAEFRKTADKKIEVIGFLKEQIHEYIEKYPFTVPDKGMELHKHLEQHPNTHHMCYLPIHAAMVCYLFNIMGGTLPQTETAMYTEFTNATLLRAIRREEEDEMINIESPQDLPDHKREMFYSICRLGFEMTLSSKQVMQKMEVRNFLGDVHCGKESMGLITVDSVAKKCGFENLYTFLHLTFQEYLAACHIFQLSETEQLGIFRQYGKERHMQVVWKFYCGLTSFEEGGPEFGEILKSVGICSGDLFGVQCAFESQQSIPCDYVVQSTECGALIFGGDFITHTDLTAICYVLENATCCVEMLRFNDSNLGVDGAKALAEGLQHCSSLQTLYLGGNSISDDGAKALAEGLQHCSSLQTLYLERNSIGDDGAKALAEGLQHCSSLQTLNLWVNSIGDDGAKALAEGLQHCSSLQTLHLERNSICDDGAKALAEGLQHCSSLQTLDLAKNSIGDDGAKALAEGLQHCSSLQTLDLWVNSIGDDGAKALAEGLQHCSSLQTLNLWVNSIGDDGAKALAEGLQHCSSLQTLNLEKNWIGDDGAKALAEGLQHCSSLQTLDLEANSISADGAKALIDQMEVLQEGQVLNFIKDIFL